MGEVIKNLFGITFVAVTATYIMSQILNKKVNFKDWKLYIGVILIILVLIINYQFFTSFVNVFNATLIIFCGNKFIFNDNFNRSLCSAVLTQLIFIISEMIFLTVVTFINNFDVETLTSTVFGAMITNIAIALIAFIMFSIPFIKKNTRKITNTMEQVNNKTMVVLIVLMIIVINLLLTAIYNKVSLVILLIINTSFISLIIYAVYYTLHSKNKELEERRKALEAENKNIQYQAENDALLNTLNEYERIADQQRVINHENTNQLNALEQMIENNEGEEAILGYIHKLKHDSKTADETIMEKTKRIPSGGLQGIIYQKMIKMKKRKVTYSLNISRDLKELDFKKLGIDTNVDMCKVIGVFLDNAIEEVKGLRERVVDIELYKDEKDFCIGITNSFGKNKNLDHIDELGYTTKGEGHGYGLSLVKQILESNKRLENERRITGRYFTQVLRIKNMK